ncbi:MAG: hypothetical protein F6K39_48075, partial [Okeania sp. SIO3B3]|nr:hypothetical protein [Okeania sp. SIO3B3]
LDFSKIRHNTLELQIRAINVYGVVETVVSLNKFLVSKNKHLHVRSFLTGFDGEKFVDIGKGDITRIFRLAQHIDKLISNKTVLKGRQNKHKRQGIHA